MSKIKSPLIKIFMPQDLNDTLQTLRIRQNDIVKSKNLFLQFSILK